MIEGYPKVLIISHNIFEETNNIGKTLISLFYGWPSDKICQIYLRSEKPTFKYCDNYYRITDREMLKSYYKGKKVVGTAFEKSDSLELVEDKKADEADDQKFYNLGNKRIPLISLFRDLLWKNKAWKNDTLKEWLNNQHPDVVLFVPNDYELIFPIASFASEYLNVPLIPYIMDDAFYFNVFVSPVDYLRRLSIRKKGKKLINQASNIITIGPKMSKAYADYFKKPCIELMNSVKTNDQLVQKEVNVDEKFCICYVGNLHSNRWKTILKIGKAIDNSCEDIIIDIFTGSTLTKRMINDFLKVKCINLRGKISPQEVPATLKASDALLFVESFDKKSAASTAYSLSTKIPEYLNSFRPIIAIGPANISSIEYLKENNLAIVCDDLKNINNCLTELKNSSSWYDCNYIHKFIMENHDIDKNREKMKNIIFEKVQR